MAPPLDGRPRVLVLLKSDGIGGVERLVASLADLLHARGVQVEIVTLGPSAAEQGILHDRDVTVLDPPVRRGPLRRLAQLVLLRRLVRARPPAAVVAFGPSASAVAALGRRRGVRTVVAEVGDPFIERRRRWNRWWRWTHRRADVLVVQTDRLAEEVRALRTRPPEVAVIGNVLPPHVPHAPPTADRALAIVGVGRFSAGKRYDDLLAAFARLGPAADGWRITLLGDGEERDRWSAVADELGIADRVEMPGFHPAPWEVLAGASVFALCSAHEGFPTVLLEAMASGCAVVASDCRFGPRDVLGATASQPESGLLYPVGDVDALAARLRELLADHERRISLATAAARRVHDFGPDVIGSAWLDVLGLAGGDQPSSEPGQR